MSIIWELISGNEKSIYNTILEFCKNKNKKQTKN